MSLHYPPNWQYRINKFLNVPTNHQNERFWTAWATAEGGSAQWNPLNTTFPLPFKESWPYNGSDVQNYWKPAAGLAATVLTLVQLDYGHLLGDLQAGVYSAEDIVGRNRQGIVTWGTNPDTILAVLKTLS